MNETNRMNLQEPAFEKHRERRTPTLLPLLPNLPPVLFLNN